MQLIIEGKDLNEINGKIIESYHYIMGNDISEPVPQQCSPPITYNVELSLAPKTTGSVEQDLAVTPTSTPSREDLTPKRKRRTKAEMAATSASDLADGPANSRPVTQPVDAKAPDFQGGFLATPESMHKPVEPQVKAASMTVEHFKENFTQTIFLLLQNQVIDQTYIQEKMKYYNLSNLMNMKNDDDRLEHFYGVLVSEGKL